MNRRGRMVTTCAVLAALAAPVALDRDSFPLSTYPMYSRTRPDVVSFATAQGIDAAGRPHTLTLHSIGASDDPLIVAGELRAAIAAQRAAERCAEIAERVDAAHVAAAQLVAIEVVVERHEVVAQVAGDDSLVSRTVYARCATATDEGSA